MKHLSKLMEIDNLVLGEFNENNDDILYGKNYQDKTMMMANSQEYYDTCLLYTSNVTCFYNIFFREVIKSVIK